VGLNAHKVLDRREWRRLGTSPLLHADLAHLVSNATSLVLEGLPLEARLGSLRFGALLASAAALSQGLYCEWVGAWGLPCPALPCPALKLAAWLQHVAREAECGECEFSFGT